MTASRAASGSCRYCADRRAARARARPCQFGTRPAKGRSDCRPNARNDVTSRENHPCRNLHEACICGAACFPSIRGSPTRSRSCWCAARPRAPSSPAPAARPQRPAASSSIRSAWATRTSTRCSGSTSASTHARARRPQTWCSISTACPTDKIDDRCLHGHQLQQHRIATSREGPRPARTSRRKRSTTHTAGPRGEDPGRSAVQGRLRQRAGLEVDALVPRRR